MVDGNKRSISDFTLDEKAKLLMQAPENLFTEIMGISKPKNLDEAKIYADTVVQKSQEVIVHFLKSQGNK